MYFNNVVCDHNPQNINIDCAVQCNVVHDNDPLTGNNHLQKNGKKSQN